MLSRVALTKLLTAPPSKEAKTADGGVSDNAAAPKSISYVLSFMPKDCLDDVKKEMEALSLSVIEIIQALDLKNIEMIRFDEFSGVIAKCQPKSVRLLLLSLSSSFSASSLTSHFEKCLEILAPGASIVIPSSSFSSSDDSIIESLSTSLLLAGFINIKRPTRDDDSGSLSATRPTWDAGSKAKLNRRPRRRKKTEGVGSVAATSSAADSAAVWAALAAGGSGSQVRFLLVFPLSRWL